ncbi:MAG TPA: zf-HC2 domain-containing protein, partial [Pyrinomonadaceae bacterium]
MTEEFDKEIDSLLRRAAKGESVQAFDAHMDADEVSLFAENALTAKARARAAEHLAECAKCRKILSHLISFDAEPESETI